MKSRNPVRAMGVALVATGGFLVAAPGLAGDVAATAGWTRVTQAGAKDAAGYLVLTNNGAEERKLLRITSPACDMIRVHRSAFDAEGKPRLWPVSSLALQPGETLRFEPNGLQLTCNGIAAPFRLGTTVPLVLQFDDREPAITIQLEVRPSA